MTRDQQLAMLDILIHEAKRREAAVGPRDSASKHLAAVLREIGHIVVVARLDDDVNLETYEAIGGDEEP